MREMPADNWQASHLLKNKRYKPLKFRNHERITLFDRNYPGDRMGGWRLCIQLRRIDTHTFSSCIDCRAIQANWWKKSLIIIAFSS